MEWTTRASNGRLMGRLRKLVLGDGGLLLLAAVCGLLVALVAVCPGVATPRLARLVAASGMTSWLPVCGLACWRGVIRRGWNTWSVVVAVAGVLGSVAMMLYAEVLPL